MLTLPSIGILRLTTGQEVDAVPFDVPLCSLEWTPALHSNGADITEFEWAAFDGVWQSEPAIVEFDISAVNDKAIMTFNNHHPLIEDGGPQVQSNITVYDIDGSTVTVYVKVNVGVIFLDAEQSVTNFVGNNTKSFYFTATTADASVALSSIRLVTPLNYNGVVKTWYTLEDSSEGSRVFNSTVRTTLTVAPINDPPVIGLPAELRNNTSTTMEDTVLKTPEGWSIDDVDAGSNSLMVTILSINSTAVPIMSKSVAKKKNVIISTPSDDVVILFGTTTNLKEALDTGLSFKPITDFFGTSTVQITLDDRGSDGKDILPTFVVNSFSFEVLPVVDPPNLHFIKVKTLEGSDAVVNGTITPAWMETIQYVTAYFDTDNVIVVDTEATNATFSVPSSGDFMVRAPKYFSGTVTATVTAVSYDEASNSTVENAATFKIIISSIVTPPSLSGFPRQFKVFEDTDVVFSISANLTGKLVRAHYLTPVTFCTAT